MAYFNDSQNDVFMPEPDEVVLPDWYDIYGRGFTHERRLVINKKLLNIMQYENKVENFFFTLGLIERFCIQQQDPQYMFGRGNYDKYSQRARRLMSIFNCVTENILEEERLCRAFFYGIVDYYNVSYKIFCWLSITKQKASHILRGFYHI